MSYGNSCAASCTSFVVNAWAKQCSVGVRQEHGLNHCAFLFTIWYGLKLRCLRLLLQIAHAPFSFQSLSLFSFYTKHLRINYRRTEKMRAYWSYTESLKIHSRVEILVNSRSISSIISGYERPPIFLAATISPCVVCFVLSVPCICLSLFVCLPLIVYDVDIHRGRTSRLPPCSVVIRHLSIYTVRSTPAHSCSVW